MSAATRKAVLNAIESLDFQPNTMARNLAAQAAGSIAVLVPNITNPFFPELLQGIQELTDERGLALVFCDTGGVAERDRQYLDLARRGQVDGLILIGIGIPLPELRTVLDTGVVAVCVDRIPKLPELPSVQGDHGLGAKLATIHLLSLGHTRIVHLTGPANLSVAQQRLAGFRAAMKKAGAKPGDVLVRRADFSEEAGRRAVEGLLRDGVSFTAIFAGNDLCAIGAINGLYEAGIEVPKDVSVIGFDGIHIGAYVRPSLSTVAQPIFDIGRTAAQLLVSRLEGGGANSSEHIELAPTLLLRRSTAAPRMEGDAV